MRLVQATVARDDLEDVKRALHRANIDFFATHETGTDGYESVLYISIPEEDVERVLGQLYDAGLDADDHVVIIETEVDIFGRTDGQHDDAGEHARIAAAELEGKVEDLLSDRRTYVSMLLLSTIVATTGLLLDSAAVVVGAMVIAPLFGPAVSTSVGTVIDNEELYRTGIRYQLFGVLVAVATAVAFAWIMRVTFLTPTGLSITSTPEIAERLSPDILSLIVALAAGIAGVLSIATGAGRALVGVMMAAALLPPAATVGIGVAWMEPLVAANSGILLGVNVLAINLAGLATLWYLGYRPRTWLRLAQARPVVIRRVAVLGIAVGLSAALLLTVTYANAQQSQLESALEGEIEGTLATPRYANVSLVDVKAIQDQPVLVPETERVAVTVATPPGEYMPGLQRRIDENVTDEVGTDVPVEIRITLLVEDETLVNPSAPAETSS